MTPDPDELLRQITDAGLYPQRLKPLQQRYQLGQQFLETPAAQGRNVGSTYVAASPFEHLANAVRQFAGARMMKGAQTGQQDLTTQLGAERSAYAKALQGMSGKPGEFMPGGEGDVQGQQRLAMLGSLSGDPGMEKASQTALQERHLGVQESQMQNLLRHQQILEGQGQQRIGISGSRVQLAEDALAQKGIRWDSNLNKFVNIAPMVKPRRSVLPGATGLAAPAAPPATPPSDGSGPPPPPGGEQPIGKWQDKALKELGADFNPSSGRSGEFGKNQARLNAAQRLLTLAQDPKTGGPANLTPQQMSEVSGSLATLIGGGSSGEGTRRELTPYTKGRSMAELVQWFTDAPHGADQQAFVQQMIDTAKRESGVAQHGIDQVRGQLVNKHQRILKSNPQEARKVLQGFGWDIGPDGTPVQAQQAAPAGPTTDTDALRKKYGL